MASVRISGSFDDLDRFLELLDVEDDLTITFSSVRDSENRSADDEAFDSDPDDDASVEGDDDREEDDWDDDEEEDWDDSDYEDEDEDEEAYYAVPIKSPTKNHFDDAEDDEFREDCKRARDKESDRRRNGSRNQHDDFDEE